MYQVVLRMMPENAYADVQRAIFHLDFTGALPKANESIDRLLALDPAGEAGLRLLQVYQQRLADMSAATAS